MTTPTQALVARVRASIMVSHPLGCAAMKGVKSRGKIIAVRSGLPCSCGNEAEAYAPLDSLLALVEAREGEPVRWYVADARGRFTSNAPFKVKANAEATRDEFNASDAKGMVKPYTVVPLYTGGSDVR